MKVIVLLISLLSFSSEIFHHEVTEISERSVQAVFDAYEGELYFFTEQESKEALTLMAKDKESIKKYKLEEAENIGSVFKLKVIEEGDQLYILDIIKL